VHALSWLVHFDLYAFEEGYEAGAYFIEVKFDFGICGCKILTSYMVGQSKIQRLLGSTKFSHAGEEVSSSGVFMLKEPPLEDSFPNMR
jgi:hypothetical protein